MPVSGLILSLRPDAEVVLQTLEALQADPRVTLGERRGWHVTLALDTASQTEDRAAWSDLQALPGVVWIDLVTISVDPDEAETSGGVHHDRRH